MFNGRYPYARDLSISFKHIETELKFNKFSFDVFLFFAKISDSMKCDFTLLDGPLSISTAKLDQYNKSFKIVILYSIVDLMLLSKIHFKTPICRSRSLKDFLLGIYKIVLQ